MMKNGNHEPSHTIVLTSEQSFELRLLAVNPGHWTEDMREDALSVAELSDPNLKVPIIAWGECLQ